MVRVLVVDDSSFMRRSVTHMLESDISIKVVDTASDGEEAVRKTGELRPDVVVLDIAMPVMDGLAALSHIMSECPTPVLVLSGLGKKDAAIAIKSLERGAVDYIAKPSGVISYDIEKIREELILKVKAAACVSVSRLALSLSSAPFYPLSATSAGKKIVVIGASTGGVRAIIAVMSGLPRGMTAAVLIVQHMSQAFVPSFAERLKWESPLNVSVAVKDGIITLGQAFVAPGGCHTGIVRQGSVAKIIFTREDPSRAVSPSVDYAMKSAAREYGDEALGVLLTGMGNDGAEGIRAIKEAGGSTIAEDESTCVVFGMPKAAIETGCVDEVLPLPQIAGAIMRKI